jgi:hypothetical protein
MTYQTIPLGDLKQAGSRINVRVEAMPFPGKIDGNGGFICSLARSGKVVPASVSEVVHALFESSPGVYHVTGEWTGTQLDVHDVEMTTELPIGEKESSSNIYREDGVPESYVSYLRRKNITTR